MIGNDFCWSDPDSVFVGGFPATLEELDERFRDFMAQVAKGKDQKKVRLVLE